VVGAATTYGDNAYGKHLQDNERQDDVGGQARPSRSRQGCTAEPEVQGDRKCCDDGEADRSAPLTACHGVRSGCGCGAMVGPIRVHIGWLPGQGQFVAAADLLQARGNEVFDSSQAFRIVGFDPEGQRFGSGMHRPPTPAEVDNPVGVGPFDVQHRRGLVRVGAVMCAWPVTQMLAQLVDVSAELDEVPAGAVGLDSGFGGQHASPSDPGGGEEPRPDAIRIGGDIEWAGI